MLKNPIFRKVILSFLMGVLLVGTGHAAQTSEIHVLNRPPLTILDIQYSLDGQQIARVYADGRLEVLEADTGEITLTDAPTLPNPLFSASIDWSPTGDRLATGIGSQVSMWDMKQGKLLETVKAGGDEPLIHEEGNDYLPESFTSVLWDSTGTLIVAESMGPRFTVWSIEKHNFIFDLTIGTNPAPVVWLPGEQRISTGVSFLDLQTQKLVVLRTQKIPEVETTCGGYGSIRSNEDLSLIAWGTYNGCVVIIDANTGNQIAGYKIADNGTAIWSISWSPDGSAIVAADEKGAVQVVDLATGSVTLISQEQGALYAVDWSPTDNEIAWGGRTDQGETLFETMSVENVRQLMVSDVHQPEFAITSTAKP
ncbi:MAG TPA: hypothetical protein VHL11_09155 [Phototrophicaceae bacterium]|nr:hypothetical protein [Phototrophicaceae bacterium]